MPVDVLRPVLQKSRPMILALHWHGFDWWLIATAAAISLASGMALGHRAHRWLYYSVPRIGERLPADTGAWAGLLIALAFLLL